ncbi:MAG: tetratricopeptide repeat protein [bacterium]|nr:tetratricopeptide repeat protein [bacterium]
MTTKHTVDPTHPPSSEVEPEESSEPVRRVWIDWLILLGIVGLALVLRMVYVSELRSSPEFDAPQMDALYHDQWAQAIVGGEEFVEGPYFRAPLYPHFLAAIYKVFGHGSVAPRVVQGILGSFSCGLVFLIGRRLYDRRVGVLAGLGSATYWILIYFDGELLIPVLIVFLDLVMIWLLVRASQQPGPIGFGLAGLALGLSAIARPNILLFGPAVVVWLVLTYRADWRRTAMYVACFFVGCVLPIVPVTARNILVGDDAVLVASQGGVNFYIGNNPDTDGSTAVVPGTPPGWWEGYHASIARAERDMGRTLRASEVSRYYFGEALDFYRDQPGSAAALLARKLWLFWNRTELGNNQVIYFWTERFTPLIRFLPLGFGVVAPLGLLGMALAWRRRGELFPLWGFVVVYMVSVVLFFCTARYRTPILGPLMILGAHGCLGMFDHLRRGRWRRLASHLVVLVPAAALVNAVPADRDPTGGAQSRSRLGEIYFRAGRSDLALQHMGEAVEGSPDSFAARNSLGWLLLRMKQPGDALRQFRVALSLTSRLHLVERGLVKRAHLGLADGLRQMGEYAESVGHYRRAIDLDPDGGEVEARHGLATALAQLGQTESAIEAYRRLLAREPDYQDAHYNLAYLLGNAGRLDEATMVYREALRLAPEDAAAWHELSRTLRAQGEMVEAVSALRQVIALRPMHGLAVEELSQILLDQGRHAEALKVLSGPAMVKHPGLVNQLAWLLATCPEPALRDGSQAIALAELLCPRFPECDPYHLDTLAAALAEGGRFERAVDVAQHALAAAQAAGDERLAGAVSQRLIRYQAREPYHEPRPR